MSEDNLTVAVKPLTGVLMWEIYNEGRLPYENRTNGEVVESLNAGLRLLKPRLAPNAVYSLMEWCWKEVGMSPVKQLPNHTNRTSSELSLVIVCVSQKPEDRPSFAVLLHELAALSDL